MSVDRAPFPYFGGKNRVASLVWERFGSVPNYVEPFAGSLAVLLGRPSAPRTETVNDLDCYLSNFWRAIQADPAAVAQHADWPVNECDLRARHRWLVTTGKARIARLKEDPEFYDAKVAGWWVWGICAWIGDGWCRDLDKRRPHIATSGNGIHSIGARSSETKVPAQIPTAHGTGVHQKSVQLPAERNKLEMKRPHLSGGERGIHSVGSRLPEKKPRVDSRSQFDRNNLGNQNLGNQNLGNQTHLANGGRGCQSSAGKGEGITLWFEALSERLRYTRVCCGDWTRVVTPAVTTTNGQTAVFLDPPYDRKLRDRCYTHDAAGIAEAVRAWAITHGGNPLLRIALCGYEDEFEGGMPAGWDCVAWKTGGGYGNIGQGRGRDNAGKERIWFSPNCLRPGLFSSEEHYGTPNQPITENL